MNKTVKTILLGVTGGVAAYKSAFLVRSFTKSGIDVRVVMTEAATKFISKTTMQALSGKPVPDNMWDNSDEHGMEHIDLSRDRDLILIAPASANFLAKLASGGANDLLSTVCLARNCPLVVAPAMNHEMWNNKSTQRNINQLKEDGVSFIGPAGGNQACGEIGMGRMAEPEAILEVIQNFFRPKCLSGCNILVTAGGTFEKIDSVRGISNQSSGRMGFSIAQAAMNAGAKVTLVAGNTSVPPPKNCNLVKVLSASDMLKAVKENIPSINIFISVAAVADYRVRNPIDHKLKKDTHKLSSIELEPTPDILQEVSSLPNPPFCVGFAAETEDLEINAKKKRVKKNIPLIVGNLVQNAIDSDYNELVLIDKNGTHTFEKDTKLNQSNRLINHIAALYEPYKS